MKIVRHNLPKQLLFFLTLLLAITPACKRPDRKLAQANAMIASGSTFTALGGVASTITAVGCAVGVGVDMATLGLAVAGLACAPIAAAFLIIGIPLLVVGVKKKKTIKKQRLLEKLKQEQIQESEEIREYTPIDEFSLKRIES